MDDDASYRDQDPSAELSNVRAACQLGRGPAVPAARKRNSCIRTYAAAVSRTRTGWPRS